MTNVSSAIKVSPEVKSPKYGDRNQGGREVEVVFDKFEDVKLPFPYKSLGCLSNSTISPAAPHLSPNAPKVGLGSLL